MKTVLNRLATGHDDRMDANHVRDDSFAETALIILAQADKFVGKLSVQISLVFQ